jgi:magnesium transporter
MVRRLNIVNNSLVSAESEESPIQIYISPDQNERNILLNTYNIDNHTLSSALDPDEVPRIEFDQDSIFIIWKRPMNYSGEDNFFFNVASMGVFLFKEKLVIVLSEDVSFSVPGIRLIPKISSLLLALFSFLYSTIHHYIEHLKIIKQISRALQKKINTSMENEYLIQMFNLSESLVYYVNGVNANNSVLIRLRNHAEKLNFSADTIELLDDIIIENSQCLKQAEIYSTVLGGLMDARGNLVNNNMNVLLRKLTIINVVFLPLNLIASIGGMSEFSIMTRPLHWGISYSLFLVAMIILGWITAFLLGRINFGGIYPQNYTKKKWLHFKKRNPVLPNMH